MTFEMKLREREKKGRTEGLDEGLKQGLTQGRTEGVKDAKLETAKKMIQKEYSIEEISELTNISITEIKKLKQEMEVFA